MKQLIDFRDKRILLFGASSGIGRQTAVSLSELGATLFLVARREEELQKTLSLCEGEGHFIFPFDVTRIEEIGNLISSIVLEHGALDGMVYSVGMSEEIPVSSINHDRLVKTFETNYYPFVECVKQVSKKRRFNEGFRIVGVSSVSSFLGEKSHCAYAGSKAAMDASMRVMAKELAAKGICINTVAPGLTMTEPVEELIDYMKNSGDGYERTLQRQYLGVGQPEDVANAICFLLSVAAKQITGVTLPVDGGFISSC